MLRMTRAFTALTGFLLLGASVASAQAPRSTAEARSTGAAQVAGEMSRHTMDGQVTKVDAKRGWIDVKTSDGSMKLHFPPEALTNVKKGDAVSVDLGLKVISPSASIPDKAKSK
jgi:hypothetical protein